MANIVSIVSSKGGTGKTTVALNLAVAIAERGDSVLLIDADPLGAIGFSLAQSDTEWMGLAECLLKKASIEDTIIQTKLPALSILARGRLDPLDVAIYEELLASPTALSEIVSAVKEKYRLSP